MPDGSSSMILATPEAQDAYLSAAFATRHPLLISEAVNAVSRARSAAGIKSDDAWETTLELFQSPENARHVLEGIAQAEQAQKVAGFTPIDGSPS